MHPNDHRADPEGDHLNGFEKYERHRFGTQFVNSNPCLLLQEEIKLKMDTEEAWQLGQQFCLDYVNLTASSLYLFSEHLAMSYGWRLGGTHCGYLSRTAGPGAGSEEIFIQQGNGILLRSPDSCGNPRQWIYRVHFVHPHRQINAFSERPLSLW